MSVLEVEGLGGHQKENLEEKGVALMGGEKALLVGQTSKGDAWTLGLTP